MYKYGRRGAAPGSEGLQGWSAVRHVVAAMCGAGCGNRLSPDPLRLVLPVTPSDSTSFAAKGRVFVTLWGGGNLNESLAPRVAHRVFGIEGASTQEMPAT